MRGTVWPPATPAVAAGAAVFGSLPNWDATLVAVVLAIVGVAILWMGLWAWIVASVAEAKGYDGGVWAWAGVFLGAIGLLWIAAMPSRTQGDRPP